MSGAVRGSVETEGLTGGVLWSHQPVSQLCSTFSINIEHSTGWSLQQHRQHHQHQHQHQNHQQSTSIALLKWIDQHYCFIFLHSTWKHCFIRKPCMYSSIPPPLPTWLINTNINHEISSAGGLVVWGGDTSHHHMMMSNVVASFLSGILTSNFLLQLPWMGRPSPQSPPYQPSVLTSIQTFTSDHFYYKMERGEVIFNIVFPSVLWD